MNPVECQFEADVLAAVLQSRWPEQVDAGLRAHVETCGICSEVAAVAGAFDGDSDGLRASAAVPDASRVWWRAQLRARREAVEAAGRPITAAQVMALACAMGLLGACFGATSTWFQSALGWAASSVAGIDIAAMAAGAAAMLVEHRAFILSLVAVVFVVPTAVYLAMGKD